MLPFKPVNGGRGRGRWYKKIAGREVYFGWGLGVSDRASYLAATAEFERWKAARLADAERTTASAAGRHLQHELSVIDVDESWVDIPRARQRIEQLEKVGAQTSATFRTIVDGVEKRRLIASLGDLSLDEIRRAFAPPPPVEAPRAKTTKQLLEEFVEAQRDRMQRRQKLDQLREAGQVVHEPAKQNLSEGRFAAITRDVASMKGSVGAMTWDGTEACAAGVIKKFRAESDAFVLDGTHSPNTFNDRIKTARLFCAWAEATYQLERLPRDRSLFSKYQTARSTAKAIPLGTLRRLWSASDDRGRCWLLLGLNCAYYAQDISNLTVEMIRGAYLHHERAKTGVKVKYKLWKKTQEYLKKVSPSAGRVFQTEKGTPLVHYGKLKKSGEPVRVDNVRNWFFRLCRDLDVSGFSFSNVRDTASTEVEKIDGRLNDLFLAHRDPRMAALYVDAEMVDSTPLDRVIHNLESRLSVWKPERSSSERSM